jgi:hypothetical protein
MLASSIKKARVILKLPQLSAPQKRRAVAASYSPVLDTSSTPRTTVCSGNALLSLRDGGVGSGSESGDTGEGESTVTTLGGSLRGSTRWSAFLRIGHAEEEGRTASFFKWCKMSFPPGVFTTLLLLEVVL